MFVRILIGLAVVIGVFAVIVALQPSEYRVSRTTTISAPPSVPFAHVNNLQKMHAWSPWSKIDPNAKNTFEGPEEGVGAVQSWVGNNEIGEGRQTIIESRPNELVAFKLEFFKPFAGNAEAEIAFAPSGGQTQVTWSMTGEKSYLSKAICMFMSMDKMIGGTFEKGLADLKTLSESQVNTPTSPAS